MKFKLDENLGRRCEALLRATGHDVATVASQNLQGTDDVWLFNICATKTEFWSRSIAGSGDC